MKDCNCPDLLYGHHTNCLILKNISQKGGIIAAEEIVNSYQKKSLDHQFSLPLNLDLDAKNNFIDESLNKKIRAISAEHKFLFLKVQKSPKENVQVRLTKLQILFRMNGAVSKSLSALMVEKGIKEKSNRFDFRRKAGFQNYINHLTHYAQGIQEDLDRDTEQHLKIAQNKLFWLNGAVLALEVLTTTWKTEEDFDIK